MISYSKLSSEELVEEIDQKVQTLCSQLSELAEVKVAKQWLFYQGYQQSHEQSVGGRQHSGEVAAQDLSADVIRLESSIDACRVLLSVLSDLLRHRAG